MSNFTVSDYMQLPEGFPAQLIDGMLVKEPSPSFRHQRVAVRLATLLMDATDRRRVALAPLDLFLDDRNVLQPDVIVFKAGPMDPRMQPAPLPLVAIEILSRGTALHDRTVKPERYLEAGIEEVWIVDPDAETVCVRTCAAEKMFAVRDPVRSRAVPLARFTVADVFDI